MNVQGPQIRDQLQQLAAGGARITRNDVETVARAVGVDAAQVEDVARSGLGLEITEQSGYHAQSVGQRRGVQNAQIAALMFDKAPTKIPAFLDLSSTSISYGVKYGEEGSPFDQSRLELTLTAPDGGTLHVRLPAERVESTAEAQPPTFLALPGGMTAEGKRAARRTEARAPITNAVAGQLAKHLATAVLAERPGSIGARVAEHLVDRFRAMANSELGTIDAQAKALNGAAELFDAGKPAEAAETLARLESSAHANVRANAGLLLGHVQLSTGQPHAARVTLDRALLGADPRTRVRIRTVQAEVARAERDFDAALGYAEDAVRNALDLVGTGAAAVLGTSLFQLGVMQKNLGRIDDACRSMKGALEARPDHVATMIATAGYLALAGDAAEGKKLFDAIAIPATETPAFVDYAMNATWFSALAGDDAKVVEWATRAFESASSAGQRSAVHQYFSAEVDLDRYRSDPAFAALLAKNAPGQ